jgi:hypothetical protein
VLSLVLPSCGDARSFLPRLEIAVSVVGSILVGEGGMFVGGGFGAAVFVGRFSESLLRAGFGTAAVSRFWVGDAVVATRRKDGNGDAAARVGTAEPTGGGLSCALRWVCSE